MSEGPTAGRGRIGLISKFMLLRSRGRVSFLISWASLYPRHSYRPLIHRSHTGLVWSHFFRLLVQTCDAEFTDECEENKLRIDSPLAAGETAEGAGTRGRFMGIHEGDYEQEIHSGKVRRTVC
jgi:hypothetical protein